jgi:hypothetical protein
MTMAALALGLLGGCSSTLNEYHCASSIDCIGENVGQCEPSGHCSFADQSCESGFRFGDNSGSESDVCVGEEGNGPDASTVTPADAGGPDAVVSLSPVAIITDGVALDCGRTNEVFEGDMSYASAGRTLTEFEWTIRSSSGEVLDTFGRSPSDTLWRAIHRRGGTYTSPRINVATYHNLKALKVDVVTATASGGEALQEVLDPASGSSPNVRISFAIGKVGGNAAGGTFRLLDSVGTPLIEEAYTIDSEMVAHSYTLNDSATVSQPLTVNFAFDAPGQYWFDNLTAVDLSDGDDIANDGSAEFGSNAWSIVNSTTTVSAPPEDLPSSLRQNGVYTIELRVTDSTDEVSAPDSAEVTLADCP